MNRFILSLVGLSLGCALMTPTFAADRAGRGGASSARPQMMMGHAHEMATMLQNTAIWTPQGLIVLQGNRLLHYTTALQLQHTVTLPTAATMTTTTPALRSLIPAKLLPTEDGVVVVRGQQIIRLNRDFKVVGQATIPDLPPMTEAELNAANPMCQSMMMMMMTYQGEHGSGGPGAGGPGGPGGAGPGGGGPQGGQPMQ